MKSIHFTKHFLWTYILLVPLFLLLPLQAFAKTAQGVIGKDDRQIIENWVSPWSAIGHVNVAGYRQRKSCTGTLIAPNIVLTAAHCLTHRNGTPQPVHNIHFVAGVKRSQNLGHSKVKCAHMSNYAAALQDGKKGRDLLPHDYAVLVLETSFDIPPLAVAVETRFTSQSRLIHPSYPADRRFLLSVHDKCRVLGQRPNLVVTDCDTNSGSSGGPVIKRLQDGTYALVGVMVAIQPRTYSFMIPVSSFAAQLEQIACPKAR